MLTIKGAKLELPYINKVVITGRLVRNPELRTTNNSVPVSNFKIACYKEYLDDHGQPKEEVCYIGIATWNELAERCNAKLAKGTEVQVEGELKSRLRRNENGVKRSFVEIRAVNVSFLNHEGVLENLGEGISAEDDRSYKEKEVVPIEENNPETEYDVEPEEAVSDNESQFSLVNDEHEEL